MKQLNLPEYEFKLKQVEDKLQIFDEIRNKYVALTPEEWVRQNFVRFLVEEKKYSRGLIQIEMPVNFKTLKNRCDIAVYNRKTELKVIVECKATDIKISQDTFDQIARYNMNFKVEYLIVTNGLMHYCCKFNKNNNKYKFISVIPEYNEIT